MREIIAKPNHDLFFRSQIASWFGKGVFGKSNRAMRKIIAKPNHVLFFWKVGGKRLGTDVRSVGRTRDATSKKNRRWAHSRPYLLPTRTTHSYPRPATREAAEAPATAPSRG
jgi:hypothetical protein